MTDVRPAIMNEAEYPTLRYYLTYLRESVIRKTEGLTDEQAHTAGVPSGTSLAWLLAHLSATEHNWFVWSYLGEGERLEASPVVDPSVPLSQLVDEYRAACARSDEVVDAHPDLDAVGKRTLRDDPPSLRWIVVHMIEETGRHAGHADILRELIDGSVGR
ncbi:hypothetical protein Afil01_20620 [Actinorhabdospora filicis]|uniref:Mini-circle protein n=1 Tax=Actinorhabdospora filicis TaxID=1785913 RepID=A0A9W6WA41_9ACTN|nr:DinB family protein [Actinorhabdospora filicis]GLZ77255.1 hypothetical protein Afil01_20620 [Actinorhabdospora filicis]